MHVAVPECHTITGEWALGRVQLPVWLALSYATCPYTDELPLLRLTGWQFAVVL